MEILEDNKEKFGTDFIENKKILEDISIVRSKELKNELAGFITKLIKREIRENEEKLAKEAEVAKKESKEKTTTNDEQTIQETESKSEDAPAEKRN